MSTSHVWVVANLDHDIWVVIGGGEEPTRPMIFEATREDPDTTGGQGRCNGVTFEAVIGLGIPRERQWPIAVDDFARLSVKSMTCHDSPP